MVLDMGKTRGTLVSLGLLRLRLNLKDPRFARFHIDAPVVDVRAEDFPAECVANNRRPRETDFLLTA